MNKCQAISFLDYVFNTAPISRCTFQPEGNGEKNVKTAEKLQRPALWLEMINGHGKWPSLD